MKSRGAISVSSKDRQFDDLTMIRGISPPRQEKLNEEFDIYTLEDMATVSDETAKAVAKAIRGVSLNMVKDWRASAREELSSSPDTEEEGAGINEEAESSDTESEWKSLASFVVVVQARQVEYGERELRIDVLHRETDLHGAWPDDDADWMGLRSPQPWEWIVAQVDRTGEAVLEAKQEAPIKPKSDGPTPIRVPQAKVKVTHIHAYQPIDARAPVGVGKAGGFFRGTVRGDEPFALEACFELAATNGADAAQQGGTYHAQFYASNRSTGERIYLNSTEPERFIENQSSYTAMLPSATLPPGNYKLQVLVRLGDRVQGLGFLEVPMLLVV